MLFFCLSCDRFLPAGRSQIRGDVISIPSLLVHIDDAYPPIHRVFTQILGLDESKLAGLEKAGVIGNRPAGQ